MTLLERLKAEHEAFRDSLAGIQAEVASAGSLRTAKARKAAAESVARAVHKLVKAVRRHEEVERRLLFPALSAADPDVAAALDGIEGQHAMIDRSLEIFTSGLREASSRPPSWLILSMLQFSNLLRRHMAREEAIVFPLALEHLGPAALSRLGEEAERSQEGAAARRRAAEKGEP